MEKQPPGWSLTAGSYWSSVLISNESEKNGKARKSNSHLIHYNYVQFIISNVYFELAQRVSLPKTGSSQYVKL